MTKKLKTVVILILLYLSSTVYSANITEKAYMSVDVKTGGVLIEKNADKKIYPASTTKILTCILALENLNLDDEITVTKEMLNEVPVGSSTMKLVAGEKLTVEQLLYGLMVPSGNDAAIVIAYSISGSLDNFASAMNEKAKSLGCTNSSFTCPHGFHDDNHYTTTRDMSKIMMYAITNEKFMDIIKTKNYSIPASNEVAYERKYTNTNTLLGKTDYIICGKTGYTEEAGNVFVSYSKKDDYEIINLLYDGAKGYFDGDYRFNDTITLNNYIFENYSQKKILDKNSIQFQVIDKNQNLEYFYSNTEDLIATFNNSKKHISYSLNTFTDENVNATFCIKAKGYDLEDYIVNMSKTASKNLDYNYNLIYITKVIFYIFLDVISFIVFFICLANVLSLKKQGRRKKIKKKYI